MAFILAPILDMPDACNFILKIESPDIEREPQSKRFGERFLAGPEPVKLIDEIRRIRLERAHFGWMGKGGGHVEIGMGRVEPFNIKPKRKPLGDSDCDKAWRMAEIKLKIAPVQRFRQEGFAIGVLGKAPLAGVDGWAS